LRNIALPQLSQASDLSPANAALGPPANNGARVRTRDLASANAGFGAGFGTNFLIDAR
jgi:hypothetical protein